MSYITQLKNLGFVEFNPGFYGLFKVDTVGYVLQYEDNEYETFGGIVQVHQFKIFGQLCEEVPNIVDVASIRDTVYSLVSGLEEL